MSIRDKLNFIPHARLDWKDPELLKTGVANLIHQSEKAEDQWIVEITNKIGDWRSKARRTYIRWALAINGLFVAERTYRDWPPEKQFLVSSLRMQDGHLQQVAINTWGGAEAANNHRATAALVAGYGVCDLHGCLEEIIFAAYRTYLNHHRFWLLKGPEYKELRTLYKEAKKDPSLSEEWERSWIERLDAWQRKRAYDGLGAVFLSFMRQACQTARKRDPGQASNRDPSEVVIGVVPVANRRAPRGAE